MNLHLTFALGLVAAAAAAATSGVALADDITMESKSFVSAATRADVRSELKRRALPADEWALQYNHAAPLKSSLTGAQVRQDYVGSRNQVSNLTGEDSGSGYFKRSPDNPMTLGGSAR